MIRIFRIASIVIFASSTLVSFEEGMENWRDEKKESRYSEI